MTESEMTTRANEMGYDLTVTGRGKRATWQAAHRASGERLCPTMGLGATMRLVQADYFRRTAPVS
jgi:hypothetical protein